MNTNSWLPFYYHQQTTITLLLLIAIAGIAFIKADDSCSPINCSTSCTPTCSTDQVCVVGTMTTCGVCPQSKCVSRTALGLPSTGTQPNTNSSDHHENSSTLNSNNDNSNSTNNNNSSNGALIGGIVGGLLGGGALLCLLGYVFVIRPRCQQKKRSNIQLDAHRSKESATIYSATKPTTTTHDMKTTRHHPPKDEEAEMHQQPQANSLSNSIYSSATTNASQRHQPMSGVIPVTFIPPTYSNRTTTSLSRFSALNALHQSILNSSSNDDVDDEENNPFHDRQSIVTTTTLSTVQHHAPNYYNGTVVSNSSSRRASIESDMSSQIPSSPSIATTMTATTTTATMAQATQVMRAKPQIMRVNTINQQSSSATRKVSLRRTTRSDEQQQQQQLHSEVVVEKENPFDDKNKVVTAVATTTHMGTSSGNHQKATTDSVMSTPGDGEITIIWHAN